MTPEALNALLKDLPPFDDTALDPETLFFVLSLAVFQRPKVAVEAGTYLGHFAVPLARMLPECEVWTADPNSEILGTPPNLHFVRDDFDAMCMRHLALESIDLAFLDSGPPYTKEQGYEFDIRYRHWEHCKPYVRSGGLMLSHDMSGTWYGRDNIAADCRVILPTGRGLGIWQKS